MMIVMIMMIIITIIITITKRKKKVLKGKYIQYQCIPTMCIYLLFIENRRLNFLHLEFALVKVKVLSPSFGWLDYFLLGQPFLIFFYFFLIFIC
jgi:hypothetical protein